MAWKIDSEARKLGFTDIKRYCWGICVYSNGQQESLWWSKKSRKWIILESMDGAMSTHAPCFSYRAFLRHLRKHPELKGYEVCLVGRYVDSSFLATWQE